jgi:hypothetical protein
MSNSTSAGLDLRIEQAEAFDAPDDANSGRDFAIGVAT